MTGDSFMKLGFWSQLVLLALVDWATLTAFFEHGAAGYHYVAFAAVNIVLLWLTAIVWRWLRVQRGARDRGA